MHVFISWGLCTCIHLVGFVHVYPSHRVYVCMFISRGLCVCINLVGFVCMYPSRALDKNLYFLYVFGFTKSTRHLLPDFILIFSI